MAPFSRSHWLSWSQEGGRQVEVTRREEAAAVAAVAAAAAASKKKSVPMVAASGGSTRVRVRYDAHLPSLSLRDGEQTRLILTGAVLPTLRGHVLCKNWHMCVVCWEDCER